MKITDNYKAKYTLWASEPHVVEATAPKLPRFKTRRFSSHAEMNAWKQELLREIARTVPVNG